jgi:hypothetical protein
MAGYLSPIPTGDNPMTRRCAAWVVLAGLATCTDCASGDFWNHSSQGLEVDASKIGTGAQAVSPINDNYFVNGEAVNLRRGR